MTAQDKPMTETTEAQKSESQSLVEYKDRLEKENKALRQRVLSSDLERLGLAADQGLGKAIAKEYKGDLTYEALASYAQEEYGHVYEGEVVQPKVTPEQIETAQKRADQVQAVSEPVTPPTDADRLAKHDEKLMDPESTRRDAEVALYDKANQYVRQIIPFNQQ